MESDDVRILSVRTRQAVLMPDPNFSATGGDSRDVMRAVQALGARTVQASDLRDRELRRNADALADFVGQQRSIELTGLRFRVVPGARRGGKVRWVLLRDDVVVGSSTRAIGVQGASPEVMERFAGEIIEVTEAFIRQLDDEIVEASDAGDAVQAAILASAGEDQLTRELRLVASRFASNIQSDMRGRVIGTDLEIYQFAFEQTLRQNNPRCLVVSLPEGGRYAVGLRGSSIDVTREGGNSERVPVASDELIRRLAPVVKTILYDAASARIAELNQGREAVIAATSTLNQVVEMDTESAEADLDLQDAVTAFVGLFDAPTPIITVDGYSCGIGRDIFMGPQGALAFLVARDGVAFNLCVDIDYVGLRTFAGADFSLDARAATDAEFAALAPIVATAVEALSELLPPGRRAVRKAADRVTAVVTPAVASPSDLKPRDSDDFNDPAALSATITRLVLQRTTGGRVGNPFDRIPLKDLSTAVSAAEFLAGAIRRETEPVDIGGTQYSVRRVQSKYFVATGDQLITFDEISQNVLRTSVATKVLSDFAEIAVALIDAPPRVSLAAVQSLRELKDRTYGIMDPLRVADVLADAFARESALIRLGLTRPRFYRVSEWDGRRFITRPSSTPVSRRGQSLTADVERLRAAEIGDYRPADSDTRLQWGRDINAVVRALAKQVELPPIPGKGLE